MRASIKNIIFDFGGVVFKIDEQRTLQAFSELLELSPNDVMTQFITDSHFLDYECGLMTTDAFIQYVQSRSPKSVTRQEVETAWNAMLLGYPIEHIYLLQALRKKYHIYLLSNTNAMHTEEFPKIAQRQHMPFAMNAELFEKVWYSNEIHLRKPDVEIFRYALRDAQLRPEETIFVDDLAANVAAAASLGIQVRQVTKECGILSIFSDWI